MKEYISEFENKLFKEFIFDTKEEAIYYWRFNLPLIGELIDINGNGLIKKIKSASNNFHCSYVPKNFKVSIELNSIDETSVIRDN